MHVKDVAELAGISIRTLHHYDEIGLLIPDKVTAAGYRLYTEENLDRLQQILFFRELGFPLRKIKEIIESPTFEREEALELQRNMLLEKRRRLDEMIATINKTIKHSKGEIDMTGKEKFTGFDFSKNPYEQEARERWGDKAVDRASKNINNLSPDDKQNYAKEFDGIYQRLAAIRHLSPDSPEAQAGIKEWYDFLNESHDNYYTPEIFKGLGDMYVDDERFKKNIDKYGEGLAVFMRDAMKVFSESKA